MKRYSCCGSINNIPTNAYSYMLRETQTPFQTGADPLTIVSSDVFDQLACSGQIQCTNGGGVWELTEEEKDIALPPYAGIDALGDVVVPYYEMRGTKEDVAVAIYTASGQSCVYGTIYAPGVDMSDVLAIIDTDIAVQIHQDAYMLGISVDRWLKAFNKLAQKYSGFSVCTIAAHQNLDTAENNAQALVAISMIDAWCRGREHG